MSIKRIQQATMMQALIANRFAGSGGGSGMNPIQLVGSALNGDSSVDIHTANPTTYSIVTGVTTTFVVGRTGNYLLSYTCQAKATTTGAGVYAYGYLFLDSAKVDVTLYPNAIFDKGNGGYTSNSGEIVTLLGPAQHTLDFRVSTDDNTTHFLNYNSYIWVFQLG